MNLIDVVILVPIIYAAWKGFKHGLIIEIFTLLALFVGLYAGIHFSDLTANILHKNVGLSSKYIPVIAFSITFLGIGAMVYFLGKTIERIIKVTQLTPINKLAGVFFSVLKYIYILSTILILLESYDEKIGFFPSKMKEESLLYHPIMQVSKTSIPGMKESTIFVHNLLDTDTSTYTLKEIRRAKFLADSIGVQTNDSIKLREIYFTYEN
ncbi:MAG: CvpA family protein [Crocinitomicaceae bacterium]|jgi:membrane protein required for colicin V production